MKRSGYVWMGMLVLACGGDHARLGTTNVMSTAPTAFVAADAAATYYDVPVSSGSGTLHTGELNLTFAAAPGVCDRWTNEHRKAGLAALTVKFEWTESSAPIRPGTYRIPGASAAASAYGVFEVAGSGPACDAQTWALVSDGTLVIASIAGGEVRGEVDLLLNDGTRVAGAFVAPVCAGVSQPPTMVIGCD